MVVTRRITLEGDKREGQEGEGEGAMDAAPLPWAVFEVPNPSYLSSPLLRVSGNTLRLAGHCWRWRGSLLLDKGEGIGRPHTNSHTRTHTKIPERCDACLPCVACVFIHQYLCTMRPSLGADVEGFLPVGVCCVPIGNYTLSSVSAKPVG